MAVSRIQLHQVVASLDPYREFIINNKAGSVLRLSQLIRNYFVDQTLVFNSQPQHGELHPQWITLISVACRRGWLDMVNGIRLINVDFNELDEDLLKYLLGIDFFSLEVVGGISVEK